MEEYVRKEANRNRAEEVIDEFPVRKAGAVAVSEVSTEEMLDIIEDALEDDAIDITEISDEERRMREIDALLEADAEAFVESYVQVGGQ